MNPESNPNTDARALLLIEVEARMLEVIRDAFAEFEEPAQLTALARRFTKLCEYRGLNFSTVLEGMRAKGLVHVLMLSSLKRFVAPKELWDALSADDRAQIFARLQQRHVRFTRGKAKFTNTDSNPNHEAMPYFTAPEPITDEEPPTDH